mmetsp:Transcript_32049/g.35893  ORF Transcript_32049/g.35893 Transcript_32049/m.35893 type:complete len:365 (-) Transcript_32049:174-1268(-)
MIAVTSTSPSSIVIGPERSATITSFTSVDECTSTATTTTPIINDNLSNNLVILSHSKRKNQRVVYPSTCSSVASNNSQNKNSNYSSNNSNNDAAILKNRLRTINPTDYAMAAFKANTGYKYDDMAIEEMITKQCLARFIEKPTKEMLDAYKTEIVMAVRNNNVSKARQLFNDGIFDCNACNKFGESILHIACRRGHLEMVQFLIVDVGLKVEEIRDDYHRTPLHDAFWTSTASYDVVDFLLKQPHVVDLLLVKDVRGYTPLDYARSEHRGKWLHFLWKRKSILRPTTTTVTKSIVTSTLTKSTSTSTISSTDDEIDIRNKMGMMMKTQKNEDDYDEDEDKFGTYDDHDENEDDEKDDDDDDTTT